MPRHAASALVPRVDRAVRSMALAAVAHARLGRLRRLGAALLACTLPAFVMASEPVVLELQQRLAANGVEATNAYLVAHPATKLLALTQATAACDLGAVALALDLNRSANARANASLVEALRLAVGNCPAFVLALTSTSEVPRLCASLPHWNVGHTVRELRRRMAAIENDPVLGASQNGKLCHAAYLHELKTTRVVLRSTTPPARTPRRD